MGRQAKKCPKKCTKHLFSLKPVHYSAFFSRESQFSYCSQNSKTQGNIPKFNTDRKAYTASFILACDQLKLQSNDQIYLIEHERIKKQNYEQKTQLFVPKPKTKNSFCSVCKQIYDDYLEHIYSLKHRQQIKTNIFNAEILHLCQGFGNNIKMPTTIIFPDQILDYFPFKISHQTLPCQQNQKKHQFQKSYQEPEFFIQKPIKQNLDGLLLCKSIKSFHSYAQLVEPKAQISIQNKVNPHSLIKQINQNCFVPPYGPFKAIEQTASPIKTKIQRPIILSGKSFTLDS